MSLYNIDDYLAYDLQTKIIYYRFTSGTLNNRTSYMSPYYSENGKLCRYMNGNIVEIGEGKKKEGL